MRKRKDTQYYAQVKADALAAVVVQNPLHPKGRLSIPIWEARRMVANNEPLRLELEEKIAKLDLGDGLPDTQPERRAVHQAKEEFRIMLSNLNTFKAHVERVISNTIISIHEPDLFANPTEYQQRVNGGK